MKVLAILRPDDWNLPLFVHVLGAFTLVGALTLSAAYLFAARRDTTGRMVRLGFRSLAMFAIPAYIVMRVGAQWIASTEEVDDSEAAWITIGYISTEGGLVLLLGATIATGLASRRATRAAEAAPGGRGVAVSAWVVSALIALYAVVIWVMATKPV